MEIINKIIEQLQNKQITELIIALFILLIPCIGSSFFSKLICKILKVNKIRKKENEIYKNLKVIFVIIGIYLSISFLQLPVDFTKGFSKIIRIVMIILITKLAADCINPKMGIITRITKDYSKCESSLIFVTKIIKGLIYLIGIFIIISELGYDLSGIITGLGLSRSSSCFSSSGYCKKLICRFCNFNR